MKKRPVIFLAALLAGVVIFYLWTAVLARKRSDELMSKFKEIDKNLVSTNDSLIKLSGLNNTKNTYPVSIMKSGIILLIDSLKEKYESPGSVTATKQLQSDIKRLLKYIQQLNEFKWNMMDSQMPDTINYWPGLHKFSEKKWFTTYFENNPKEASITYLNYLRNQALANNQ